MAHGYLLIFILSLLFIPLSGCAGNHDDETKAKPAVRTVERGPVRVTIEVKPSPARLSDELTLTLTIDSAEGVKAPMPPFAETLGDFQIRDIKGPLPKVRDGREIVQRILTLEPTRAGLITIDPINIAFTDLRPDGDGKVHTLETEPITVEITTQLSDDHPSLDAMRAAADPVDLPAPVPFWVWALIAVAAIGSIVGGILFHRRRREKAAAVIVLTPEEIANRELDELVASRLAERDVVLFYVELTAIVRRYIERTTGIRAPEQTTEEFLRVISQTKVFERGDSDRLRNFLEAADLVKFAAHRPRDEDIDESVNRARLFIGMRRMQQIMASKAEEVDA